MRRGAPAGRQVCVDLTFFRFYYALSQAKNEIGIPLLTSFTSPFHKGDKGTFVTKRHGTTRPNLPRLIQTEK